MELILLIAAAALIIVSFLGLMKILCRIFGVLCLIGAVWFWVNGGRDKLATGLEAATSLGLEQTASLGGEDRQLLEAAMRDPKAVLGPQKERVGEILAGLLENPEISSNEITRKVLEQLATKLDQ